MHWRTFMRWVIFNEAWASGLTICELWHSHELYHLLKDKIRCFKLSAICNYSLKNVFRSFSLRTTPSREIIVWNSLFDKTRIRMIMACWHRHHHGGWLSSIVEVFTRIECFMNYFSFEGYKSWWVTLPRVRKECFLKVEKRILVVGFGLLCTDLSQSFRLTEWCYKA